jgi:ankyrin repeat protein
MKSLGFRVFSCLLVLFMISACGDPAGKAKKQLESMGIPFTEDAFIEQLSKANTPALELFFAAGISPVAKNKEGLPAIVAAMDLGNEAITTLFMERIPLQVSSDKAAINVQDAKGRNAMMIAAGKGDVNLINLLYERGAAAFIYDQDQNTPLHYATNAGLVEASDLLIKLDAQTQQDKKAKALNFSNNNAETPLLIAAQKNQPQLVKLYLDKGANPDLADRRAFGPIIAAAQSGSEDMVRSLLDAKAKIDIHDVSGLTPLKAAIKGNHIAVVKLLLERGADPDFTRSGDELPVQIVLSNKPFNSELFALLKSKSKKVETVNQQLFLDAVENNNPDVVKKLLEQGLDPNSRLGGGKTVLYHAVEKGYEKVAMVLLDKGADSKNTGGTLPILELAVRSNMIHVVKHVLDAGANPDIRTNEGFNLAEIAVYKGYPEVLELLLSKKAGVKLDYAVLWAIRDGKGKAVPVLLKYGANPNVLSQQGDPALWLAVSGNQEEAIEALLKNKAIPNVYSERLGNTALGLAAYIGNIRVVQMLVDAGAKVDEQDRFGVTPLGYAALAAKFDTVQYLLSKGANKAHIDKQSRTVMDLATASQASGVDKEKILGLLSK